MQDLDLGATAPRAGSGTAQEVPAAGAAPTISIIVVSYNTREMTLACLRSVIAETRETGFEILVVDNASADGSAAAIAAEFPDIRLMAETDNHGFAKSNNIAAREARGAYLLLLNPDTLILDGAIDRLMRFARETPAAKIWGGRTLYGDRSLNRTACFQRMSLWTVFCRIMGISAALKNHRLVSEAYGGWAMDTVRRVDIVTGCFLLIPRPLWEALEGFDPRFFMYGEEADLCLRATRDFGADPHYTPDAVIVHYGGASEPVRTDKMVRLFRAKLDLIRAHFPAWQRPLGLFLFRMIPWSRARLLALAARLLPRAGLKTAAAAWGEIWARRGEWRG